MVDDTLPPRFGITTSNMSEATNVLFKRARDCHFLDSIDIILDVMISRIAQIRERNEKVENKDCVVPEIYTLLKKRWENSAGCTVIQIDENSNYFKVNRVRLITESERTQSYELDLQKSTCTCGRWQEHDVPCVDFMAYLRHHERKAFQDIMKHNVSKYYTYNYQCELFRHHIKPVTFDLLVKDNETKSPVLGQMRQSGRPRKQRLRKTSMSAVCRNCGERGHYSKTCNARRLAQQNGTGTGMNNPDIL